jgi:hypothetical protein
MDANILSKIDSIQVQTESLEEYFEATARRVSDRLLPDDQLARDEDLSEEPLPGLPLKATALGTGGAVDGGTDDGVGARDSPVRPSTHTLRALASYVECLK